MASGKLLRSTFATTLLLALAACSSSDGTNISFLSATQDLGADPTGQTTVLTFGVDMPATLVPGNFSASAGQNATGVTVAGPQVTVVWDDRVTPSHSIAPVAVAGVAITPLTVTTTDASPATFTVTDGQQVPGLGNDTIEVTFAGANVLESCAEDSDNWTLMVNGSTMDLTGSVFDLDPVTQVLDVTLGPDANLHASFMLAPTAAVLTVADVPLATTLVAGAATGDAVVPTLVSAEQNLAESEFGFVVDFTFSEAMDPVFSVGLPSFDAGLPVFATDVEQIGTGELLRVTFTEPVIPGLDTIDLSGLLDAHGNAFVDLTSAIAAGSTVANSFSATPLVSTVENTGGDTVVITLTQAIDPASAEEFARWRLESPTGVPVDLTNAAFDYVLATKTLTITLVDDDLITGDTFLFGASAGAPFPLDVDGQDFTTTDTDVVGGDMAGPMVVSVTQNRTIDSGGLTYDIELSEDIDSTPAIVPGNYTFSAAGTSIVGSPTLLAGQNIVRVELDTPNLPGTETVQIQNLTDLAGNAMTTVPAAAIGSTDTTAPNATTPMAQAIEGIDNDTLSVVFDDLMVETAVTDLSNWTFESPIGTGVSLALSSAAYNAVTRRATLTFDGGDDANLKTGDDFLVSFTTMTDIGGNVVSPTALTGAVVAEQNFPELESVWVDSAALTDVHIRFSEPCTEFDPSGGMTEYVIRDSMGLDLGGGTPTVVVDADQRGATLTFALGATAGSDTLDLRGVTDLAGNQMFPLLAVAIAAEDAAEPGLDPAGGAQSHLVVSGEENDVLTVTFDRPVSTWNLFDPANWVLTNGSDTADFSTATFSYDGSGAVTVSFDRLGSFNFDNGSYTLTVDNLSSSQGVDMTGSSAATSTSDIGSDVIAPMLAAGRARLDAQDATNSVLVELDEAIDFLDAVDPTKFAIGGTNPVSVTRLGYRTVRATFGAPVVPLAGGETIDVTVADLGGTAGLTSQVVQTQDATGPTVTSVAGVIVPNVGGDVVEVVFNEPVDPTTALLASNYTVSVGTTMIDLSTSQLRYESSSNTVSILLPDTTNLLQGTTITVTADGVTNHSGLVINPPANINGSVGGDSTAPDFSKAFANYREDAAGLVIDVQFDEDVDASLATTPTNYSVSGGQTVSTVVQLREDTYRLTLSSALMVGDMITAVFVQDLGGNLASGPVVTPQL